MSAGSGPLTCILLLIGTGLYFAPDSVAARLRGVITDSVRPGQLAARRLAELTRESKMRIASKSEQSRQGEIDRLQEQLRSEQMRTASMQIQLARLADVRRSEDAMPDSLRSLPRLSTSSLIHSAVLGDIVAEDWRRGKLLDRGQAGGVRESELVIKSTRSLVDVGRDANLSPEDGLLLGRTVIGKVERVGRWTSTFLLLTDSGYRGRAQLVHQTDTGYVFGAKGILEGQGEPLCRLKGIVSSDAVTVGDSVYTATREGQSATPLYYGRVVEATLGPSDTEWQVLVEPVPIPNDLTTVQILRTSVNSDRLSAGL